ncbi:hypothetical protein [Jeotgalibacillus proteolyticus]|uniref:hypothetical protein n=1 Tax=Jeotgalibacillus proteolyticus TaxID=2082395 RepID=UPI001AD9E77F|nr:hypothetical protein [Jeotgalibacillus proteolyticus]
MNFKKFSFALTIAIIGALLLAPLSTMAASSNTGSKMLKNVKVTGVLEDGGTFDGMMTIENLSYDEAKGLVMSGTVKGKATQANGERNNVNEAFENVPASINQAGTGAQAASASTIQQAETMAATQAACDLLNLDLGPIFLDLLGLQLDLSEINLDLTAVPGAGNLLGNLLCGVAGLLDGNGFLSGIFDQLSGLLNSLLGGINSLLG